MSASKDREWSPRLWEGMDFFAWLRLLAQGRAQVSLPIWYIAGIITGMSFTNTLLRWLQQALHGRAIDAIRIDPPPIFVLGHWRTGTTLLHELLMLDHRHTGPTTLHCFEPCHCVLSEKLFRKHLQFLLPSKRPMDNMPAGWDQPQEDEFALALLGQPSPYHVIAWPNQTPKTDATLNLSGLSERQLQEWKRALVRFLKMVLYLDRRHHHGSPRRLVLKSPPHTARIPMLLELFPDARFVYLHRDPHVVYLSTIKLWQSFANKHGLQTPRRPDLIEQKVLREYRTLIESYRATRHLIPPGRLVEVKYEDLAADLLGQTQRVYVELKLDNWSEVRPQIEQYVAARASYVTNRFEITDSVRTIVADNWGDLIT